jgi:protein tyrosine phosphatase (PTP) superfamily phosphohydrolase (DUF442 family)
MWRFGSRVALALLLIASTGLCWQLRRPWFEGNFAAVDAYRVYRSAQPTGELERWIRDYGIKSILNLRGGTTADPWYKAEVRAADAHGVSFYDLPLSATRRPNRRELELLIGVLADCPYPLLIHCKSGADRTGLASALYLMMQKGETPQEAENAFSLQFGHVPLFGTEHLHEPLDEYASWLKARQLAHLPERFRSWVETEYRAPDPHQDRLPLEPGPRPQKP